MTCVSIQPESEPKKEKKDTLNFCVDLRLIGQDDEANAWHRRAVLRLTTQNL